MIGPLRIREATVYRLAIPLRFSFEHAAASRRVADPVVVRLQGEAPYNDVAGYGETLARPYVTGENVESVSDDVEHLFLPHLLEFRASSFAEAVEFADALPTIIDGRLVNAARTAVELALLDLAGQAFGRRVAELAGWLDRPAFQSPGSLPQVRYSGIAVGRGSKLSWGVRLQRLYGLRDFKLKVAVDGWEQRLERVHRVLGGALRSGNATLRVDANGGWSVAEASKAIPVLQQFGVEALEQPLPAGQEAELLALRESGPMTLIADESLTTIESAETLIDQAAVRVFNVRIAKNGGLLPALKIAAAALEAGRHVQLGCLVGETSLLAAAGVAFLECCPRVRYAEGAYAPFFLKQDVTRSPVRFRYGGRMAARRGYGLGVDVAAARVEALADQPPRRLRL